MWCTLFFLGVLCLGTSGEPIKDILRYSKIDTTLEAMKKTLDWRHLAPTCPDTVPSTPCVDTDPFVIYNCPAIYFCGNCEEFGTDLYTGLFLFYWWKDCIITNKLLLFATTWSKIYMFDFNHQHFICLIVCNMCCKYNLSFSISPIYEL